MRVSRRDNPEPHTYNTSGTLPNTIPQNVDAPFPRYFFLSAMSCHEALPIP